MAEMTELERIEQAEEYFRRYFEMKNAVTINEENKEYLKTYIHDEHYVAKNFNMKHMLMRGFTITISVCFVMFILMGVMTNWLVGGIVAGVLLIAGSITVVVLNKYRLANAQKEQREVNEGIKEQLVLLDERKAQLERQRDNYYKALGKRVDCVPLDYMKHVGTIKQFMTDGLVDTCEDAVAMYEQSLLMKQMTDIMKASEVKEEEPKKSDLERFGDPIKMIKENKRKKKKDKSFMG